MISKDDENYKLLERCTRNGASEFNEGIVDKGSTVLSKMEDTDAFVDDG